MGVVVRTGILHKSPGVNMGITDPETQVLRQLPLGEEVDFLAERCAGVGFGRADRSRAALRKPRAFIRIEKKPVVVGRKFERFVRFDLGSEFDVMDIPEANEINKPIVLMIARKEVVKVLKGPVRWVAVTGTEVVFEINPGGRGNPIKGVTCFVMPRPGLDVIVGSRTRLDGIFDTVIETFGPSFKPVAHRVLLQLAALSRLFTYDLVIAVVTDEKKGVQAVIVKRTQRCVKAVKIVAVVCGIRPEPAHLHRLAVPEIGLEPFFWSVDEFDRINQERDVYSRIVMETNKPVISVENGLPAHTRFKRN